MSPATTRSNYDRLSRWYDLFAGSEARFTRAGVELMTIQAGQAVLEIGCGTGQAVLMLAAAGARVVGMDISAGMLRQARKVLRERPAGTVSLVQADALALPLEPGSFEAVLLSFTVELFAEDDIRSLLSGCRQVMRPGGTLVVVALAHQDLPAVRMYARLHAWWPQVIDCRPIDLHPFLAAAGFEVRKSRIVKMWGLPVEILAACRE